MAPFHMITTGHNSDPSIDLSSGSSNDSNLLTAEEEEFNKRHHRRNNSVNGRGSGGLRGSFVLSNLKKTTTFKKPFSVRKRTGPAESVHTNDEDHVNKNNDCPPSSVPSSAGSLEDEDESIDISSSAPFSRDDPSNNAPYSRRHCEKSTLLDLAEAAGTRAEEYLEERFANDKSVLTREKVDSISEYFKSDLAIGKHLGKGCFSDVFEVVVAVKEEKALNTRKSANDADELDKLLERMEKQLENKDEAARVAPRPRGKSLRSSVCVAEVLTAQIAEFALEDDGCSGGLDDSGLDTSTTSNRLSQRAPARRSNPKRRLTLAMKCLRPQIRSDPEQFMIGVEDLIHETAMLVSLDHKHIVKLHGRAEGKIAKSFQSNNGYFILLDRLVDTLEDRLNHWKETLPGGGKNSPTIKQVQVACAISDALSYLHMNNIVFRDLKPANVGFDSTGVLKLFDFGFAAEIPPLDGDEKNEHNGNALNERAGTIRYMAPEVNFETGYKFEADVYSFGILFWEICNLKKPFSKINTADEFEKQVFIKGGRPKLGKNLPANIKELISSCWDERKEERPSMSYVRSILTATIRDMQSDGGRGVQTKRSKMMKRLTWDL